MSPITKPQLLAPAGNLEKLKAAVLYGADAVYLGGEAYGMRAAAGNFTLEEMAKGITFAHSHGAKVYVTVNIMAHNRDLIGLPSYLNRLAELGVDGLIVADPGVIKLAQAEVKHIPLHLSTQANTTNWASALFWQDQGISRLVLARELNWEEIKEIRAKTTVELEAFVHGAMCISYSGRCLLSHVMTGRDANRGECTQPCRWRYRLVEETRPGQYFPVEEDERGTYVFNSRDLCLLPQLPLLMECGLDCFKIEGRMKSVHYVATVVKAYRQALDAYFRNPLSFTLEPGWLEEIGKVSHREYTTGFFLGREKDKGIGEVNLEQAYLRPYDFVGLVLEYRPETGLAVVEQRGRFRVGESLEFVGPQNEPWTWRVKALWDEEGKAIEVAPHPRQRVMMEVPRPVQPFHLVRRRKEIITGEEG